MDFLQEYLPQAYHIYATYYHTLAPYLLPVFRFLLLSQAYFYRYIYPTLYPLYVLSNNALHTLSSDSPDLITLAVLAVILIVSIRALDYMRRSIIAWIAFALKFGAWVSIGLVWLYFYQRGYEQGLEDVGWVWGLLQGLGDEGEAVGRQKARGRESNARRMAGAGKRGRTRGAGW